MTEKQYGGASPHGLKNKNLKSGNNQDNFISKDKSKKENLVLDNMEKEEIESYLKAGKIVAQIRKELKDIVKKDVLLLEIAEKVEGRIVELSGEIAFPVNTCINEIAAHETPTINDDRKAEGLIKIDFGVSVDGFIADNSVSFDLTEDKKFQEMIDLNEKALKEALDSLDYGSEVSSIGKKVSKVVNEDGRFRIVKNLCGHSMAQNTIHAGMTVPNTENENNFELKELVIAIEPFLTTGKGEIYEGKDSDYFALQDTEKKPRERDARKLLDFIKEEYSTKPFCKRWLNSSEKLKGVSWRFALKSLTNEGILHNYPVLIEKDKKPVSQAEHSVIFYDGKKVVYTRD